MVKQILLLPVYADNAFRDTAAENAVSGKPSMMILLMLQLNAAVSNVTVLGDHFASEEYRKHLAKVYLKKALQAVM